MVDELEQNRRLIRIGVYIVLAATVSATFLTTGPLWHRVHQGVLPLWLPFVGPALFTIFVLVFSIDRYIQVRRGNYPLARALMQLGLAVVFLAFLWPPQARELRAAETKPPLRRAEDILNHRQPSLRALACQALAANMNTDRSSAIQRRLEREPDERVIEVCTRVLENYRRTGQKPPESPPSRPE